MIIVYTSPFQDFSSLPNKIRIFLGSEKELRTISTFALSPAENQQIITVNGTKITSNETGEAKLRLKVGSVPVKTVNIQVLPDIRLYPGGQSIGVKLRAAGILVVGHKQVVDEQNRHVSPAEEANIQIGDMIQKINNQEVDEATELSGFVTEAGEKGKSLDLQILRGKEKINVMIKPVKDREDQQYKLGLFVRDSAAGVGTMTFYDPESKKYGALGHVISDLDTQKPIIVGKGTIVPSKVTSIERGKEGKPGSIRAVFPDERKIIGSIEKNTSFGIFGKLDKQLRHPLYKDPIPIALIEQVKEGPAEILTVVEGNQIERYSIEIINVIKQRYPSTKGMIIKITDPKLLQKTGGIVQGMSGSPIIQDGKLIGAVTHVFVNDPTQGYGLFIEWMIDDAGIKLDEKTSNDKDKAA